MKTRFTLMLAAGLVATLLVSVQHAARPVQDLDDLSGLRESSRPLREIVPEGYAPGVLGGLGGAAIQPLDVDTTGVIAPGPDLWELDADTGAQYRRGELLVKFSQGAGRDVRTHAMRAAGGERGGGGFHVNHE